MSLVEAAASGVRWTTAATIVTAIVSAGSILIVGRYVTPEEFGLVAMAAVVVGFVQVIASFGLMQAIVQRESPSSTELSTSFWLGVVLGAILYGCLLAIRPIAVSVFNEELLNALIPVLGITIVTTPFGDKVRALLQKSLQFRSLAIIQFVSVLAASATTIILAVQGRGVWALAIGFIVAPGVATVMLVTLGVRGRMLPIRTKVSWAAVRPLVWFGGYLTGSQTLNYFNSNIAQALIGAVLGAEALGFYSMAHRLVLQPIQRINPIITQVAFPVLVQVRDDPSRLKRGYMVMLRVLTSINAPILFGLAATATVLVPLALGDSWQPMIVIVQILAIYALVRSTGNAGGSLVLAIGRSDIEFWWNLSLFFAIPAAVTLSALGGGLAGVAWTLLGLQIILFFAWYAFVVRRILGECLREYVNAVGGPIAIAAAMALLVVGVGAATSLDDAQTMAMSIVAGVVAYTSLYWLFLRDSAFELMSIFFGRRRAHA